MSIVYRFFRQKHVSEAASASFFRLDVSNPLDPLDGAILYQWVDLRGPVG
jgi:hypothetical protein